jgi:poly(ADP-ribose) glycohydrolase ARH3
MSNRIDLRDKFLGGMIGTALGDAIGELAFRRPTKEVLLSEVADRQTLVYTDDTAMAIGLAKSLVEVGGLDQQHLGDTFRSHYRDEPWRGYASGPPTVFSKVKRRGMTYSEAAKTLYGGEGSFGNGAAMRVAPLGLLFHEAWDLYQKAQLSAAVTHTHPIGIDGAAVQAHAVAEAVGLDPGETLPVDGFLETLLETARTMEMQNRLARVHELLRNGAPPQRAARELGQGVAVHRSLPFAIYCFLRHPDSFKECLFCAALNGGDRDTLGAMACAVSGAYLGVEAIPRAWREKLENRSHIEELALELEKMR